MPKIHAVSTYSPPHQIPQEKAEEFIHQLFTGKMERLERYLTVFKNAEIHNRQLAMPIEWYKEDHSFSERNDLYIELATDYGVRVIQDCLAKVSSVEITDIDAIIFVSSTGISTPSIEARLMNQLSFSEDVVRIPIWGLGCGGGAAGISRANDYCLAHPEALVLVICLELCSLTFQPGDLNKSNLIGTSLFGDGVACALVSGDQVKLSSRKSLPSIKSTASRLLPNSEDVMGWRVEDNGLHVIFAKSIPSIIEKWFTPFVKSFLQKNELTLQEISQFIAHPGGKKVLAAYETSLELPKELLAASSFILQQHGNMSSPTVLFVLKHVIEQQHAIGEIGIMASLGPGFSGELVLLEWE
ncbi:MAG TPA: 3-oxoacyl-[acyl-carrier-protein] synthase III C-terminal domain-containing protein [Rummeliibacillus sp.]|nr:3-oxoacyl-[acyl-carrier-protein] synthase III C-terminal domain-containing protein [Rummeliibacillus sp.]